AHYLYILIGDGFFQSLIFSFCDVNGKFYGLQRKAVIGHFHVTAENTNVFIGIKKSVVGINLSCDRTVRWRTLNSTDQWICFVRRLFFFSFVFLRHGRRRTGQIRRLSEQLSSQDARNNEKDYAW